jgi:hypothetical protein
MSLTSTEERIKVEDKEVLEIAERLLGQKTALAETTYQLGQDTKKFWAAIRGLYGEKVPDMDDVWNQISFNHQTKEIVIKHYKKPGLRESLGLGKK